MVSVSNLKAQGKLARTTILQNAEMGMRTAELRAQVDLCRSLGILPVGVSIDLAELAQMTASQRRARARYLLRLRGDT